MRSRFAHLLGMLSCSVATIVASHALAQVEFSSSTLELKAADQPAVAAPPTGNVEFVPEHGTGNAPDSAPAANTTPPDAARAATRLPTLVEPPMKNHSRPLVNPYAGASAQNALRKMPQPMHVQSAQASPARHPIRPQGKPFQANNMEPAISPYLSLYQNNSNQNVLLNYYTSVRPQLDQIEANKKQEAEIQKLRVQVQNPSQGGVRQAAAIGDGSSEGMTVSAHYMDTAQFYHRTTHK
ncbi:MAG TPA: hypothetical protein VH107_16685 [Lacipirellulaceae bacterium]|jgi:hypothetical protein|nr:hypothetical protein [Lacipirellulaceae bacterium]